ncbi:Nucleotidyltransferase domain protein [Candidatus Omnitrophus magneticus]|uniref:Nucleotidyltransferase domain protein n=1 Tax=Candidatus Omnitrophus magneticus TaxID=1609969 RepID=A0A0F0CP88_9BACT|nr:Nucleotidyltransferase domain protein [Candidatus Omnitrophus magneticus]
MISKAIDIIKKILDKRIYKIFLFGSRARGDFREDSDWDFMVLLNEEITFKEKKCL